MKKKAYKGKKVAIKKENHMGGVIVITILAALVIINLMLIVSKRPSITGFAVRTTEDTHTENLNLVVNESKNATWEIKNAGTLKLIKASGSISRNATARVYIKKDNETRLIFDSTKPLFDVDVKVLPEYKKIFIGDELLVQIILFNLKGFGSFNVKVDYSINDPKGNPVAIESENVTVETQARFVRRLIMPSDIKPGTYFAFVEVQSAENFIGSGSDSFEVQFKFERPAPISIEAYLLGITALSVLIVVIVFVAMSYKKYMKKKRAIELKEKFPEEKIQKLQKELSALEEAFSSKFISEESFKKEKERIEAELKKLNVSQPEQGQGSEQENKQK